MIRIYQTARAAVRSLLAAAVVAAGTAAWAQDRIVGLEGQPNFRDLGGYRTSDGRTVRTGLVYRSGELPGLTDADVETLRQLGIRTVVNFLTPDEIALRGPDRLPPGVREISLPISGRIAGIPDAANQLNEARKSGDFRRFPPEFNPQIHRELVGGMADEAYEKVFDILSDEGNYPLVIHCSHGVHRTGTAAALILTALGVPWETVREDYLLSNVARQKEVSRRVVELEGLAEGIDMSAEDRAANADAIRAFYVLEPAYIDASRDAAAERHGSMAGYIADGLGRPTGDMQSLRVRLTE